MTKLWRKVHNLFTIAAFSLAVIMVLAVVCLVLALGIKKYNNITTEIRTREIALKVVNSFNIMVENTESFLSATGEIYKLNGGNSKKCDQSLANIINSNSIYETVLIVNNEGKTICGANRTLKDKFDYSNLNIADRNYFIKSKESGQFASGGFTTGRVSKTKMVTFASPVFDSNGQVIAFAVTGISIKYLDQKIKSFEIPEEFELTVVDQNNTIVTSHPSQEEKIGQEFYNVEVFSNLLNQKIISFESKNEKGILSIYSYRSIRETGSYILISAPRDGIISALRDVF